MDTVTEQVEEASIDFRNTSIWHHNCPLIRENQRYGEGDHIVDLNVTTGSFKESFGWITDDDVICTDSIDGLKIVAQFSKGRVLESIGTRRNLLVNPVYHSNVYAAVCKFAKTSLDPEFEGYLHGVIPGNPVMIMKDDARWSSSWNFIPYEYMRKHFRRDQWHKGPKTSTSLELWLNEDLTSSLKFFKSMEGQYASYREDGRLRPDGLNFWQDTGETCPLTDVKIYRIARVHNRAFAWWQIENNRVGINDKLTLNMVRKDVFEELRNKKDDLTK